MNVFVEWIVEFLVKKNAAKNVPMVSVSRESGTSTGFFFFSGNTEEEMEEYTEMFEHIDEYRSDLKKKSTTSKKSHPVEESDGTASDTTESDNESDPSSEEEDEADDRNKKSKASKKK